ncbi:phosphatidylinositol transfer protein alpha isoform [Elysia marginata]|uniref:Phosphatidylinositol transfer protein alpha isoform n=1 Tax=Elysia marginata TaxID=1093978 RepID=A0AAV4F1W8_9GAST|nr:phosphatidylinositol transfer protein alpha isoform [Elysia marginata]
MKQHFYIVIDSYYAADNGNTENIHHLTGHDLSERQVCKLDIANDEIAHMDYKREWDPCLVGSTKAGRSPLPKDGTGEWMNTVQPVVTCYKVVRVWFKWFGLQDKMQRSILKECERYFRNYYRQLVCWTDDFYGLTIEDIRKIEEDTEKELQEIRQQGESRGTVFLL